MGSHVTHLVFLTTATCACSRISMFLSLIIDPNGFDWFNQDGENLREGEMNPLTAILVIPIQPIQIYNKTISNIFLDGDKIHTNIAFQWFL